MQFRPTLFTAQHSITAPFFPKQNIALGMRQCIGQRNPVPFLRRHPREKHMLSETLDAKAFKALGVGDAPFPRQPL